MASAYRSNNGKLSEFLTFVAIMSAVKGLMLFSYRSTDFEVHRNWLAITSSLPLEKWYYEKTSEWTLDYPPFFAFFEWVLSYGARLFDPHMLKIENLNYASAMTILYQKLTVIVSDLILAFGIWECGKLRKMFASNYNDSYQANFSTTLLFLIFANAGLFIVDHIHFQYNGFLFGIMLLSIGKICQGKCLQGAVLFAMLLNFKHIFLYMAPAFGLYLFRKFCWKDEVSGLIYKLNWLTFLKLAFVTVSVFGCSFGLFHKHLNQILQRLFPFQRGLSHAYWAPNIWALYNSIDLGLNFVLKRGKSSVTGGLVGEHSMVILPGIQPIHTILITLLVLLPLIVRLWRRPTEVSFVQAVTLTAWTSFMFGFHVHEKAILNVLIPLSVISFQDPKVYVLSSTVGIVSLFPLLFTPFEIVLKIVLAVCFYFASLLIFSPKFSVGEKLYLLGLVPVVVFENLGHLVTPNLPFLPLLIMSVYTFIGNFYCYIGFYAQFIKDESRTTFPNLPVPEKMSLRTRRTTNRLSLK